MSNTVFYRSALTRELTPRAQALFQSLFSRTEQIDALADALPAQILANRTRREGKPVTLSAAAKRTIRSVTKDSEKFAAELPALIAGIRSEAKLVRTALDFERTAHSLDQTVYTSGHPEDAVLARPMLDMRAENIAELEAFLSSELAPAANPERPS